MTTTVTSVSSKGEEIRFRMRFPSWESGDVRRWSSQDQNWVAFKRIYVISFVLLFSSTIDIIAVDLSFRILASFGLTICFFLCFTPWQALTST